VAKRVGGHALFELRPPRRAMDDRREDCRLEPVPLEPAEHRRLSARLPSRAQERELTRQQWREWLTPRLATLAAAIEQRGPHAFQVEVPPVERDQPGAAQARLDERE